MKGIKPLKSQPFWSEKALGRVVLIIAMLLLTINIAFAQPIIKTYGNIDKEIYKQYLSSIPEEYYYDLNYIKIFEKGSNTINGYYWINNGIDIFHDSGRDTLIHELAHHCQIKRGDTFYEARNHIGQFFKCQGEIWKSIS